MQREILFSCDCGESWAVVREDGVTVEALVERPGSGPSVGDIYLGLVRRILPGVQAAFVDIGAERTVFLHAADVPPGFFEEGTRAPRHGISGLLREGQRVVLQIVKHALPRKGARATLHVSLPGRLLVYSPTLRSLALSRRIGEATERERLRELIGAEARPDEGFVVRTAAAGAGQAELAAEAEELRGRWRDIDRASRRMESPGVLHREEDLFGRLLRDLSGPELDAIEVEGEEAFERCREKLGRLAPFLLPRLRRYSGRRPLLEERGVRAEIDRALRPRIRLPSGGTIVITQTEALVAVDVNTSSYVGKETPEQTALATDLEAAREIVRQIRLRDLGGIIVVDFIDLREESSRWALTEALQTELARDRSHSRLLEISDFGLVQLTRKRSRLPLDRVLMEDCRACGGSGRLKSPATLLYEIRREISRLAEETAARGVEIRVHPSVAERLRRERVELCAEMKTPPRGPVSIEADPLVPPDRFELRQWSSQRPA